MIILFKKQNLCKKNVFLIFLKDLQICIWSYIERIGVMKR